MKLLCNIGVDVYEGKAREICYYTKPDFENNYDEEGYSVFWKMTAADFVPHIVAKILIHNNIFSHVRYVLIPEKNSIFFCGISIDNGCKECNKNVDKKLMLQFPNGIEIIHMCKYNASNKEEILGPVFLKETLCVNVTDDEIKTESLLDKYWV